MARREKEHPVLCAMGKLFVFTLVGVAALTAAVIAVDKMKEKNNSCCEWLDK